MPWRASSRQAFPRRCCRYPLATRPRWDHDPPRVCDRGIGVAMHGISQSVWHATASTEPHPPLQGEQHADAVVVGAGITGLTTALLLQRKGLEVAVVEADRIASGVTGSTTAKVTS